ncbi:biliverdin-producing heme oxygenase [Mucilaginibacter agri]|uniref:Heme oxygenase n=1 Tax=Mucilaginibacter agri TaxID=2695265 RepID=A0A965ZGD6_9SPHI|nr:biliverdin-producing heme oxygenase [Mucilaginibacter agri]NCD69302.1 heme oxygenase [Mucilaginibacter agri]
MLAENLKEQTLANHQQLEKKLVGQIKGLTSKEDYIKLLQLFYGYFGGLEERINLFIDQNIIPDHANRRKTESIAADITELGGTPADKAINNDLPEINNAQQALGALYVIEGSTLGGSIISKMISGRLGLQNGLSFFNSYGDNTHQMWAVFKNILNGQPAESQPVVVDAANSTFLKFENWIEQHN